MSETQEPKQTPQVAVMPGGAKEAPEALVEQPDKLIRIASMLRGLIDEVQRSALDEKSRARLANIYRSSVDELGDVLSEELREELAVLIPPLEEPVSESEVRVAQAQLLGWLEGLFHGIQAALWTQQMQARAALEEMRHRSLPSGRPAPSGEGEPSGRPGQYL
jgi:uncharacterized protein YjeT (DUF2065 family)